MKDAILALAAKCGCSIKVVRTERPYFCRLIVSANGPIAMGQYHRFQQGLMAIDQAIFSYYTHDDGGNLVVTVSDVWWR